MARQISVSMFVRGISGTQIVEALKRTHHSLADAQLQVYFNPRGAVGVSAIGGAQLPEGAKYTLQAILEPYEVARPQIVAMPLAPSRTAKQIVSAMAGRRRTPVRF
jgi:hypothetical protein